MKINRGHLTTKMATANFAAAAIALRVGEESMRRQRIFRDRTQPLDAFSEEEVRRRYCFSRVGCISLIDRFSGRLDPQLTGTTLFQGSCSCSLGSIFFATGAVLDSVACMHGISRPTASRIITRVAEVLRGC